MEIRDVTNKDLAKLITDTLIERDSKGVPGTTGMPVFLGGDMCDPRPEGIEAVVLEVLEAQRPEGGEREWDRVERRRDNWTLLLKKYAPKFDFKYTDRQGNELTFFGLVYAEEDIYYGLMDKNGKVTLSSCVGSLDGEHGWYKQVPNGGRCELCNEVYPASGPVKCSRYRCPQGDNPFSKSEPQRSQE